MIHRERYKRNMNTKDATLTGLPRGRYPRLAHTPKTDEELLDCVCVPLTTQEWARLAVLAADQAGLPVASQNVLHAWLATLGSSISGEST